MDIRDLKVFQMIAFEKSVSKAAKKLYMTPQGVSKILKNLETEMGSQLFVRDKRHASDREWRMFHGLCKSGYRRIL